MRAPCAQIYISWRQTPSKHSCGRKPLGSLDSAMEHTLCCRQQASPSYLLRAPPTLPESKCAPPALARKAAPLSDCLCQSQPSRALGEQAESRCEGRLRNNQTRNMSGQFRHALPLRSFRRLLLWSKTPRAMPRTQSISHIFFS